MASDPSAVTEYRLDKGSAMAVLHSSLSWEAFLPCAKILAQSRLGST
ncbi:hypothetical protein ApDm4_2009 [Acetobacter pomorum]|nr:hypothetical protein ApDm4_2009 [Acetobacter pomorum]